MINFPNGKINLGLNIIRKRADGYHDLETFFYPVPLNDVLEIIPVPVQAAEQDIRFSASGIPVEGAAENNLCIKAFNLLKKDYPQLPPVKMHLHKVIPTGAGLGGGSSDAAFTLSLLNSRFNLGITREKLLAYALALGSDCPFFMINKPCFATGRGEILKERPLDLSGYRLLIVNPGIHINTGWAFGQLTPALPGISVDEVIQQPVEQWRGRLVNDFEQPVMASHPLLRQLKDLLYQAGAIYSAMSGSGSTFYGIFPGNTVIDIATFPAHYFVMAISPKEV